MWMVSVSLTEIEAREVVAGIAARRRELDKAFKACMKADTQAAADKVMERMKTCDLADKALKGALEK